MLSRVDVSGSELQKKSKIDILWIHDVMHINLLLFIVPIYSASGCNVSTCVHACAIIMSHVLMHTCGDVMSRLGVFRLVDKRIHG